MEIEAQEKDHIIATLTAAKQRMNGQIEELQKEQERMESVNAMKREMNQHQNDQIQQQRDELMEMENAKSRVESHVEDLESL